VRSLTAFLVLVVFFCCASERALASRRVALVIGNSSYQSVPSLANPANDATAVTDMFKAAGFDVVESRRNLKNAELRRILNNFYDSTRDADIAVVYYAGHGIEVDGSNYIVPVDAVLERDRDVLDETIPLDRVVQSIEPARQLRLVILDACRENPFAQNMKRSIATRGITRGLARVDPMTPNTLIAFAAKAGSTADDGNGKHSPFTTSILNHLTSPGLDLRKAFGIIRDEVMAATNNKQEPYVFGSLGGADVALVPAPVVPVAVALPPPSAQDVATEVRREYEFAERVGTKEVWDYFLQAHSTGFFADLAKAQRNKLLAEEARLAATQQAQVAIDEQIRLAVQGALASEQAKAATKTKAAEEARLAAEKASEEAKVAVVAQTASPTKVASLSDGAPAAPSPPPVAKIPDIPPSVSAPGREPSAKETLDWDKVKDGTDPTALQKFIKLYPDSPLSIKAQQRLDVLKQAAQEREEKARAEREATKKAAEEAARIQAEQKKAEFAAAEEKARADREAAKKAAEEARIQAEQQKAELAATKKREEDERRAKAAEAEQKAKAAEAERKAAEDTAKKGSEEARIRAEQQKADLAAAKKRDEDERRAKATEAAKAADADRKAAETAKAAEAERKAAEAKQRAEEAERAKAAALAEAERKRAELAAAQEVTCKQEQGTLDDLTAKGSEGSGVDELKAFSKSVTCDRVKPQVVATLDKFNAEAAKRAAALPDSPELIRSAQTQLARLGCLSDKVDGVLNDKTKAALGRYMSIKGETSSDGTVTEGLVSELTTQTDRVCPLECKAGQMAKGETCVAVAKPSEPAIASRHKHDDDDTPARRKPVKRQAEREQPRPFRPAQEAPRARQEAVAPSGGGASSRTMIGVGF
jgi:caspase domain-containing protein